MVDRPALRQEILAAAKKCRQIIRSHDDVQMRIILSERVCRMEFDSNCKRIAGFFDWAHNLWNILLEKFL